MLSRLLRGVFRRDKSLPKSAEHVEAAPSAIYAAQLFKERKYDEMAAECKRLIAQFPQNSQAWSLLGAMNLERGNAEQALEYFEKAVALDPANLELICNLAEVCRRAGHHQRAIHWAERARSINHEYWPAWHIQALAYQGSWRLDEAFALLNQAVAAIPESEQIQASYFFHQILMGCDPIAIRDAHVRWASRCPDSLGGNIRHRNQTNPERRLRVGYVSADFREHALSCFIDPILRSHDRTLFEVFCYSNTVALDHVTARLQSRDVIWRDIRWDSDVAVISKIVSDEIDILVDLSGHTQGNRLGVFAHQPAPVQMTYIGYPATTGMKAMNYRITDVLADPPGYDGYYTERLLRLQRTQWCFQAEEGMPEIAPLPCERRDCITFGSLNSLAKITPHMVSLWSRVLRAVPGSRLLVASAPPVDERGRLIAEFGLHGISVESLTFSPPLPLRGFWDLHAEIDIALDSHPYNGATTTCVALWLGVPVISLTGAGLWARCGRSILSAVGLEEFVADSDEEFLRIAIGLAGDKVKLRHLRLGMRSRMINSSLMDAAGFTRDLECLFRGAWREWCSEESCRV